MKHRILVVASRPSDYVEMVDTAAALASAGHLVVLAYLYASSEVGAHDEVLAAMRTHTSGGAIEFVPIDIVAIWRGEPALAALSEGVPATIASAAHAEPHIPPLPVRIWRRAQHPGQLRKELRRLWPATVRVARRVPWRFWPDLPNTVRRSQDAVLVYRRFARTFAALLRRRSIESVLIPEDIVGPTWPVLIKASHRLNIPVLVCPYTLANREEAVRSLAPQAGFQTRNNRIAAHLFPVWRLKEGMADLVRLPSEHIFAHERLRVTPPDPWMMNSGYADGILVDSNASREYFEAGGIPPARMMLVGSISQDRMFRLRQDRASRLRDVRTRLGLKGEKPVLLISGCPNQLAAEVPKSEFKRIEDVAGFVGESLAPLLSHYHLIVRPHPNFPDFGSMLSPYGIVTTMEPTSSVVPLCDLFVAFASATIRWAIACAIPTVNYDVFHYGYGDFASAGGVTSVQGGQEFRDLVRRLTPGSEMLQGLANKAAADSAHWSVMDGGGLARIENEIARARQRRGESKEQRQNA